MNVIRLITLAIMCSVMLGNAEEIDWKKVLYSKNDARLDKQKRSMLLECDKELEKYHHKKGVKFKAGEGVLYKFYGDFGDKENTILVIASYYFTNPDGSVDLHLGNGVQIDYNQITKRAEVKIPAFVK